MVTSDAWEADPALNTGDRWSPPMIVMNAFGQVVLLHTARPLVIGTVESMSPWTNSSFVVGPDRADPRLPPESTMPADSRVSRAEPDSSPTVV